MGLANQNAPRGFHVFREAGLDTAPRIKRPVASGRTDNLMVGDAYTLDANGNAFRAIGTEGSPGVVKGIVELIDLAPIPQSPQGPVSMDYIPATEAGAIMGVESHDAFFVVQSTVFNSPVDTNKLVDLVNNTDSEALAQSRQGIDGGTLGSGTQFRTVQAEDTVEQTFDGLNNFVNIIVQIAN